MSNEIIPIESIRYLAQVMGESGLFGKTPVQIASLALLAHAEGRPLASVAMEYDIIQGRPALNSRTALARFQLAGGKIKWIESNAKVARALFSHEQGGELEITWTIERAKEIGLTTKDTWKKYPDQMLRARCSAEGIRAVYPACLGALYMSEEVQDFDAPKKTRTIEAKGLAVVVEDDLAEDGTGTIQVSTNTNLLIKMTKDLDIDYSRFQDWLRFVKKIGPNEFFTMLDDSKAFKIIEHWADAHKAYEDWKSQGSPVLP
jgi:hypothetical protein